MKSGCVWILLWPPDREPWEASRKRRKRDPDHPISPEESVYINTEATCKSCERSTLIKELSSLPNLPCLFLLYIFVWGVPGKGQIMTSILQGCSCPVWSAQKSRCMLPLVTQLSPATIGANELQLAAHLGDSASWDIAIVSGGWSR